MGFYGAQIEPAVAATRKNLDRGSPKKYLDYGPSLGPLGYLERTAAWSQKLRLLQSEGA